MPQPDPTWTLLEYEYDPDLLRVKYERPDGEYEFDTLTIRRGSLPALVAALLVHADQNERSDILRAEVAANDKIVAARYDAMSIDRPAPSWLPAFMRDGETLR